MSSIKSKYNVFYSTGGVTNIGGGSDVWVKYWVDEIAPKLKDPFYLLVDRDKVDTDNDIDIKITYKNHPDFDTILDNADKIHILHGYYQARASIIRNFNKIETNIMHCCIDKSLTAHKDLGLSWLKHYAADTEWELKMLEVAKKTIWIGLSDTRYHKEGFDIIDIPNFYEFTMNKKPCESNVVGFTARMETRKAPHFLDNIKSIFFTRPDHFGEWRENTDFVWKNSRVQQFRWERHYQFMMRDDWGISHSAHIHEPFGYSIFQAIDFGKIPILSHDWLPDYLSYPFRASTKEEFEECWMRIRELSLDKREEYLEYLRAELNRFTDKKVWVDKYLEIYNT
jgi:hypothetical protein